MYFVPLRQEETDLFQAVSMPAYLLHEINLLTCNFLNALWYLESSLHASVCYVRQASGKLFVKRYS